MLDAPAVAAEVAQAEPDGAGGEPAGRAVGPLDKRDGVAVEQLVEAERRGFVGRVQAIEVEVQERAAAVLLDERERRRGDRAAVEPKPVGDALGKVRLAGAEVALECEHVARFEAGRKLAAERARGLGAGGVGGQEVGQVHGARTPGAAPRFSGPASAAPRPQPMPTVHDIAAVLAPALDAERYAAEGDPTGVWLASDRPVRRLGLALEAGRPPYAWAEDVDAVLVHRPFGLWPARLPDGVGVLAAHRALDDRLTTGLNPALADALGLIPDDEPLRRDGAPIGLVCRTDAPLETVAARIEAAFGGIEDRAGEIPQTGAVALANAMTAELVEEAAARGVGLYLTGQIRKPGLAAVAAAGIGVRAVGQDRAEAWGLRYLRALVRQRWPAIEIVEVDLPPRQPGSM